eukprot:scaffold107531_cov18-Tisochrysis_lutea.AAC.1
MSDWSDCQVCVLIARTMVGCLSLSQTQEIQEERKWYTMSEYATLSTVGWLSTFKKLRKFIVTRHVH